MTWARVDQRENVLWLNSCCGHCSTTASWRSWSSHSWLTHTNVEVRFSPKPAQSGPSHRSEATLGFSPENSNIVEMKADEAIERSVHQIFSLRSPDLSLPRQYDHVEVILPPLPTIMMQFLFVCFLFTEVVTFSVSSGNYTKPHFL